MYVLHFTCSYSPPSVRDVAGTSSLIDDMPASSKTESMTRGSEFQGMKMPVCPDNLQDERTENY